MLHWRHCTAIGKAMNANAMQSALTSFFTLCILTLCVHATTVAADQNSAELPALFAQLVNEVDAEASTVIEGKIWQHWLTAPDRNSEALMSQISNAMGAGRLQVALLLSNQLVDSSPNFAEGWNKRATIHYLMGNNPDSVADIRETIRLEPRHFGAISGLGMIFLREKNYPAALQAFEQVLKISPASLNAKRSVESVRREIGREI